MKIPLSLGKPSGLAAIAVATALGMGLAGCSMHPLPEDVSRVSTYDIVKHLRCEAWAGLKTYKHDDPYARKIIEGTAIGYEFSFDMTEENASSSGVLDFKRASFKGDDLGFSLSFDAEAVKTRSNNRVFRVIEQLKDLDADASCSNLRPRLPNPAHPITGTVGVDEIVRSYIRLERLTDLARGDDDVVFSDELQYTTKLHVGVTPTIELVTIAGSFRLSKASITGSARRDDIHSVTVALSRDAKHDDVDFVPRSRAERDARGAPPAAKSKSTARMAEASRNTRLAWRESDSATTSRSVSRLAARAGSASTRVLLELQRRRNIKEDAQVVSRVLGVPLPLAP